MSFSVSHGLSECPFFGDTLVAPLVATWALLKEPYKLGIFTPLSELQTEAYMGGMTCSHIKAGLCGSGAFSALGPLLWIVCDVLALQEALCGWVYLPEGPVFPWPGG